MWPNKNLNIVKYSKQIMLWASDLKEDPNFSSKIRMVVFSYMIAISLLYAGYTLILEPQQKLYAKKNSKYLQRKVEAPANLTKVIAAQYVKFKKQEEELKTQVEILRLQNALLEEMWQNIGDEQVFFQVILSLLPTSPNSLEQGMASLSQAAPIKHEGYKIFTVSLNGQSSYNDLLNYFKYLESRPEISVFNQFSINSMGEAADDKLNFTIQVGRIQVEESL